MGERWYKRACLKMIPCLSQSLESTATSLCVHTRREQCHIRTISGISMQQRACLHFGSTQVDAFQLCINRAHYTSFSCNVLRAQMLSFWCGWAKPAPPVLITILSDFQGKLGIKSQRTSVTRYFTHYCSGKMWASPSDTLPLRKSMLVLYQSVL